VDPEWFSPEPDSAFQAIPNPDSTLKPGEVNDVQNTGLLQDFLKPILRFSFQKSEPEPEPEP
jgi:hypothetical protein